MASLISMASGENKNIFHGNRGKYNFHGNRKIKIISMATWNKVKTIKPHYLDVPPEYVFDLFLLELSLDDELVVTVDGA
jgi:metal-dependent HD superfamily phosphatase/phosphodiesterase